MICPCCTETLLQHAGNRGVYWFCPTCRQAMPPLLPSATQRADSPRSGVSASSYLQQ